MINRQEIKQRPIIPLAAFEKALSMALLSENEKELIDYINSSNAKPKVVQKCRNELTRRGVKLVWKPKESV